jgi:hypothetical protein
MWRLGRFRSMQNTSTGCGNHLPTRQTPFLEFSKIIKIGKWEQFLKMFGFGIHRIEQMLFASQNAG